MPIETASANFAQRFSCAGILRFGWWLVAHRQLGSLKPLVEPHPGSETGIQDGGSKQSASHGVRRSSGHEHLLDLSGQGSRIVNIGNGRPEELGRDQPMARYARREREVAVGSVK